MTVAFIQSANHMEDNINQLNTWLIDQAIHVPDGWTEACVQWLIEEHGGLSGCAQLTKADWCQLIYEQWIHADLHNLACPVLPASSEHASGTVGQSVGSTALKLEGELCLQVVGLFNVGDSYYGQLRRHEGNLSVNLPSLDNLDADLGGDPDLTQMTAQAFSQHSMFGGGSFNPHYNSGNNATQKSLAVFLTDGVTQIKAIELGSLTRDRRTCGSRVLSSDELVERLRPGVKVRLRGPLTLRNKVLLLPAGVIETLAHPQFQVLGGEVDELLESHPRQLMYQLGLLLARKLNVSLPDDGSLPTWFPRVTQPRPLDSATLSEPERPLPANVAGSSFANHSESVWDTNSPPPLSDPTAIESWSNDDDVLISEAAENFEHQLLRSTDTTTPMIHALTESGDFPAPAIRMESVDGPVSEDDSNDTDLSLEVDPDVLATAFGELEKDNLVNKLNRDTDPVRVIPVQTPAISSLQSDGSSVSQTVRPTCSTSSLIPSVELPHPPCSQTSSTNAQPTALEASDDLLPPAPKRKPWERKKPLTGPSKPSSVTSEAQIDSLSPTDSSQLNPVLTDAYKFRPFCYIEDMYNDLIRTNATTLFPSRRVYTIRGLLISLLSSLEHHQGTRWTLAARLADGSATVDVDIASELLTAWIGLTAAESESLRQMSRVNVGGEQANAVALQEARKHRQRLRTALSNFQLQLSNMSGLFDLQPPTPTATTRVRPSENEEERPVRPILIAYRPLDGTWLEQLHERVQIRWDTHLLT